MLEMLIRKNKKKKENRRTRGKDKAAISNKFVEKYEWKETEKEKIKSKKVEKIIEIEKENKN